MRLINTIASGLMLGLICSCAHSSNIALAPVGPAPAHESVLAPSEAGSLIVFSSWDGTSSGDVEHARHTGNSIFSAEGHFLKKVVNYYNPIVENPRSVELPAGTYRIRAKAQNFGSVDLLVRVEAGKNTMVYLDGSTMPGRLGAMNEVVTLPDGRVVGWRAEPSTELRKAAP